MSKVEWKIKHYSNGQKQSKVLFVNGQEHGTETYWYFNGQKWAERPWSQGHLHGTETWWNQDGSLRRIQNWCHGELLVNFKFDRLHVSEDAKLEVNLLADEYQVL